ncbi:uncharacterized protein MONBRDRAFT_33934 [Monosiga brevicollis MX1]|uniref:ShKT domain-containing protein n=1 Tax=Monosiga brevicollis TaxID=81824 RepID=A9V8L0_MONBE|nr:uncharacterized protein MONBRDRAFT_33934 [Monosiga brevicollis MX1]EDQ86163.1 predicted protein [Monosiga brevicollis MX1]|eukprot:XP_001749088.1 hypothetical protein [Monosiga brevicollis MX1]
MARITAVRVVACAALLLACGVAEDHDSAVQAYLGDNSTSCAAQPASSGCNDMFIEVLCADACSSGVWPCTDQDALLNSYWASQVNANDGIMSCNRARAALACEEAVVAALCPTTCLICSNNMTASMAEAQGIDTFVYEYNAEVIKAERRQALWNCAQDRYNDNFDCASQDVRCPVY